MACPLSRALAASQRGVTFASIGRRRACRAQKILAQAKLLTTKRALYERNPTRKPRGASRVEGIGQVARLSAAITIVLAFGTTKSGGAHRRRGACLDRGLEANATRAIQRLGIMAPQQNLWVI